MKGYYRHLKHINKPAVRQDSLLEVLKSQEMHREGHTSHPFSSMQHQLQACQEKLGYYKAVVTCGRKLSGFSVTSWYLSAHRFKTVIFNFLCYFALLQQPPSPSRSRPFPTEKHQMLLPSNAALEARLGWSYRQNGMHWVKKQKNYLVWCWRSLL